MAPALIRSPDEGAGALYFRLWDDLVDAPLNAAAFPRGFPACTLHIGQNAKAKVFWALHIGLEGDFGKEFHWISKEKTVLKVEIVVF